jgi:hypothetical protein
MIHDEISGNKANEMTILAVALMFHFAWRISNVVSSNQKGSVKHYLKASSVLVKVRGSSTLIPFPWLEVVAERLDKVVSIQIIEMSSKSSHNPVQLTLLRSDEGDTLIMDRLLKWMTWSRDNNMHLDDPMFCYKYYNARKTILYTKKLSSSMVSACIKKTVTSADLDPSLFSCHSVRIGSATEMRTMGYDSIGIAEATGMSSLKTIAKYSRRTSNEIGVLSSGRPRQRLCIQDIRDMEHQRKTQITISDLTNRPLPKLSSV